MARRLFTSDTHIGHLLVARKRGFETVEEHDTAIITRWNEEVQDDDLVLLAGDAVMGTRRLTLPKFKLMKGHKILIAGNHDDCWPGHNNGWTRMRAYLEVFEYIQPFMRITIDGQSVLISHFPYENDSTQTPRFTQFRLRDEGNWLLHGHTHSTTRRTSDREIHIGMDAWGLRPVSEGRIIGMMRVQLAREKELDNGTHAASAGDADAATTDIPAEEQGVPFPGTSGTDSDYRGDNPNPGQLSPGSDAQGYPARTTVTLAAR